MATIQVVPSAGDWRVDKNGRPVSNHHKQSRAIERAKREANSGDVLLIHNRKGRIRERREVR